MGVGCLGAQWARLGGGPWVSRASPPRAASRGVVKISLNSLCAMARTGGTAPVTRGGTGCL